MFEIRPMTAADREAVLPMVTAFYHGPAVEHAVDPAVLERSFAAAVDPMEHLLQGYVLTEDGNAVGYCYVTLCYSAEVGGRVALVEELYFRPECRGKGCGTKVFQYVMDRYASARRLRLEVAGTNPDAARLYERLGFRFLSYGQMVLDRELQEGV